MTKIGSVAVLATCTLLSAPVVTSGPFAETVTSHPEFFAPAHVSVVTNGSVAYYVYNGRARHFFKNMPARSQPQTRAKAQLRAENNLSRFLLKNAPNRTMTLRGSLQIAKSAEGDWTTYVFAVPVTNVTITLPPTRVSPLEPVTNVHKAVRTPVSPPLQPEDRIVQLLTLVDQVEQNPQDGCLQAALAKAYLDCKLRDEAQESARKALNLLLTAVSANMPEDKANSLLTASAVLKDCGDYRNARKGYQAVERLNRAQYRTTVLKAISEINLAIGIN